MIDLLQRWEALFRASYCGNDPVLEGKVRQAFASEPRLYSGPGMDIAVLAFVQRARMLQNQTSVPSASLARDADKPSAHLTATLRAAHQLLDERPLVFEDELAVPILGEQAQALLRDNPQRFRDPMNMALRASIVGRSRVAEDLWRQAERDGIRQYVVLGAGLDTYACRRALLKRPADAAELDAVQVFEVDLPAMQRWKREALRAAGIVEPSCLRFVPIDFARANLADGLAQAGFRMDEPAFFSWLGVTVYLDAPAIWQTLDFIASCAPSSQVVFDYCIPYDMMSPMERIGWEVLSARLAERGEHFKTQFAPDDLAAQMRAHGFKQADTLDVDALNACYFSGGPDKEKGAGRGDGLRLGRSSRLMHGCV
jgi:methyltransferase (TIGR00027 family)